METSHWRQGMCLKALRDTAGTRLCGIQSRALERNMDMNEQRLPTGCWIAGSHFAILAAISSHGSGRIFENM